MTSTANRQRAGVGLATIFMAMACGRAEAPLAAPPHPTQTPSGTVEAVEGRVTAQRASGASSPRVLTVRDAVWADDTVITADQASVSIRLAHNSALWLLQGGQSRRVDAAAAWRASKQAAELALADRQTAPTTASAGRHSEQEAAQTGEAATRPVEASTVAAKEQKASGDGRDAEQQAERAAHKRQILDSIQRQGVLKILGTQGNGNSALRDVFANEGNIDGDIANSLSGVGVAGSGAGKAGASNGGAGVSGLGSIGSVGHGGGGSGIGQVDPRLVTDVTVKPQLRKGKAKPADLERFAARARIAISRAYGRALHSDAELKGGVDVVVEINGGHVVKVTVLTKNSSPPLVECVTAPLQALGQDGLDGIELMIAVKLRVVH